ncbi:uncharacterized protein LOC121878562 [Homarus americanus]|uniref:uncharacterized protein LOC121878562 n=1 Tax=Homarus americanus TaxID=6706 RepID=UPI001C44AB3B|nr:uncharacterized protein LOC121878562 [Homarus americanus]
MGRQVPTVTMSEDGGQGAGAQVVVCEDKATSTDDELLGSPTPGDDGFGPDNCFRYMAQAAQLWGADLVGMDRPPERPHSARGGRYLRHQESLSSNSDVSRPHRQVKLRRQRTTESCDTDSYKRPKTRELRRQWTTDSSDSGYSKRYSREFLRRQDTEESADSTRRLIRDLQRQATTESSSSLRLTRQSSIRSASDNQSLCLLRQSTVETYDDISTTDFSRPQSCNSSRNPSTGCTIMDFSPQIFPPDAAGQTVLSEYAAPGDTYRYNPQDLVNGYDYSVNAIPATVGAPLLSTTSCSLINLSAVDLEAAEIKELHRNLRALGSDAHGKTKRKKSRRSGESEALKKAKERVRKQKEEEEMPRRVRWSIMATGLILLLMSVILVGATLKMAPLIDEMGESSSQTFRPTPVCPPACPPSPPVTCSTVQTSSLCC